jgi:tetratricopeptide (TPR) repeat protein
MKKVILLYLTSISFLALLSCGSFMKGGSGSTGSLLKDAEWNIIKSKCVEDVKSRDILLSESLIKLKQAEEICREKNTCPSDLYSAFALYYLFKGEYIEAKKYVNAAKKKDTRNEKAYIIETKILLREKGRSYAREAIKFLSNSEKISRGSLLADLTLGDCYFLLGDFLKAREVYTRILKANKGFQVESANRLETIYTIESIKLNPKQIKGILLSKGVRRDDIAYLLDKEFSIRKYIKRGEERRSSFNDLGGSLYSDSIVRLYARGMFSFIKGDSFSPATVASRAEMAKVIEDFIVYATGNAGYRSRYRREKQSPIGDVKSDHPYYNAIRLVIDKNIMDLTLGGSFNPMEPVNGIDAVVTFNRMIKTYRRR